MPVPDVLAAPPSEQTVKAQLVQEEADEARHGKTPIRATSKTTFVVAALQLEEQQYVFSSPCAVALTYDSTGGASQVC